MAETRLIRIHGSGSEGISLGILEKRPQGQESLLPPILLIHGATFGAAIFDLPLPGYSLMSHLATSGRVVYALDIRGYGHSVDRSVMDAPPDTHPPFSRLNDAVKDIGAAIDLILGREMKTNLDLIGFSWGAITSARYAGEHAQRIARLVLYAPLFSEINRAWLLRIADPEYPGRINPSIGAYRLITLAEVTQRWNHELATDDPTLYRDGGLPELVFETLSALDPGVRSEGRPAFRCPNGALIDLVSVFNGWPLYDPAKLTMPTLLIRGANDTTSTDSDARNLLSAIASPEKDYRIITPGSHFLLIEKSRLALYEYLDTFLGFYRH